MTPWSNIGSVLLISIALAAIGGLIYGHHQRQLGAAEVQARWDAQRAQSATVAASATEAARAEESRRTAAQQEAIRAAESKSNRARADAAHATAVAAELRQHIATLATVGGGTACHSVTAEPSPAAGTAPDLLADVQRRLDDAADQLAAAADAARIAGQACEQSYLSLTGAVPSSATQQE